MSPRRAPLLVALAASLLLAAPARAQAMEGGCAATLMFVFGEAVKTGCVCLYAPLVCCIVPAVAIDLVACGVCMIVDRGLAVPEEPAADAEPPAPRPVAALAY